jgi:hypothetical protein
MPRTKVSRIVGKRRYFGQLLVSKRGVYLISSEGRLRCFRLVPWKEILRRVDL